MKIFISMLTTLTLTGCTQADCSFISSANNMEQCKNSQIKALGTLECQRENYPTKAGVHYLNFEDGSELKILEAYPACKTFNTKKVEVIATLHECSETDQCTGLGLSNLQSIKLVK